MLTTADLPSSVSKIVGYALAQLVLEELLSRLRSGLPPDLPVPYYSTRDGEFTRELIE